MIKRYNLQLFAEGGEGAPAESGVANPGGEVAQPTERSKAEMFEEMISGEYKEEFDARAKKILEKRFRENRQQAERNKSAYSIVDMIAERYGVDPQDHDAIRKAMDGDTKYLEQEALEQGLSVEQLKRMKAMERELSQERAERQERERQQKADEIYAQWQADAQMVSEKYGRPIDIEEEVQNPQFLSLVTNPSISFESAWKAVHMDDILGGAMAATAENVRKGMADSIRARSGRPAENGAGKKQTGYKGVDVSKLTKADRARMIKESAQGQSIRF